MESWCSDSLHKGFVSNDVLMGWEYKNPFSYENLAYPEVGFAEIMRKQLPHDSVNDVSISPSMVTFSAISRDSSLVDLKLGGFGDNPSSKANPISSSSVSSTPAKRARVSSQTAYCQVYGCNKDLSSLKDYYKRHKVCEAHSKTSKVIVNGIEQRFCQQCSRFHLVAEFDDGKRSCRKRLAGHNERRRKPQLGLIGSATVRSLHSYAGSEDTGFQESTLTLSSTSTSFTCQEMNSFLGAEKYSLNDWGGGRRHVKVEDHEQKSVLPSCLFGKQYPFLISGSLFQLQANSLENQDQTLLDEASTVQLLPGISDSGSALSLLSSPSSSHPHYILERVETQRQYEAAKQQTEGFCCLRLT